MYILLLSGQKIASAGRRDPISRAQFISGSSSNSHIVNSSGHIAPLVASMDSASSAA